MLKSKTLNNLVGHIWLAGAVSISPFARLAIAAESEFNERVSRLVSVFDLNRDEFTSAFSKWMKDGYSGPGTWRAGMDICAARLYSGQALPWEDEDE